MSEVGPGYFLSQEKRTLDIVGSLLVSALVAGPAAATALATVAEQGPRNLFFRQRRRATRDSSYIVTKFMTHVSSVDETVDGEIPLLLKEFLSSNSSDNAFLERIKAMAIDYQDIDEQHSLTSERCTKLGNFIRIAGLDELPQVLSILHGTTSLTGPRAQTDQVLESRLRVAPSLFQDWFNNFYEPYKKGWVSPGANWYHRYVPGKTLSSDEIIIGVMERDLEWVPQASLAYDLRLLAEAPKNMAVGLANHLLDMRGQQSAEVQI